MASARLASTVWTNRVTRVRSRVCSAAANAVRAAAPRPSARAHRPISIGLEPLNAAVRPPNTTPIRPITSTASRSRPASSRVRSTGASINQKPSAAETRTGPNSRLIASAMPSTANQTAQGTRVRAAMQASAAQPAMVDWARTTRLVSMAPIMIALKMAT